MRYSRLSASFIFIAEDTRAHTHTLKRKMENNTQGYMCVDSLRRKKGEEKKKSRCVALLSSSTLLAPSCRLYMMDSSAKNSTHHLFPPRTRTNATQLLTCQHHACPCVSLSLCLRSSFFGSVGGSKRPTRFSELEIWKGLWASNGCFLSFFFFFFNSFSRFIHYWNKRVSPLEKKSRPERNKNKKEKKTPTFLSSCSNWIPNSLPPTNPPLFSSSLSEKLSFSLTSHRTLCKS